MFRSQNSLEDVLDHTAHMIQRFEGFPRGGRLNIAAQDLSDGPREDVRVSEDKYSAGIYATNQICSPSFSPDVINMPSGEALTVPGMGSTRF